MIRLDNFVLVISFHSRTYWSSNFLSLALN